MFGRGHSQGRIPAGPVPVIPGRWADEGPRKDAWQTARPRNERVAPASRLDAPARVRGHPPRWRVGLVCRRLRNFLATVITRCYKVF